MAAFGLQMKSLQGENPAYTYVFARLKHVCPP